MKNGLFVFFFLIAGLHSKAQINKPVKDSIYYQLDTAKTPLKDRMWEIGEEGMFKYYTYQCNCLKFGSPPTLIYNLNNPYETLTKSEFKRKRLISLVALVKLLSENEGYSFNHKHILYIMEPLNKQMVMHQVRLIAPRKSEPSIDYEIIK